MLFATQSYLRLSEVSVLFTLLTRIVVVSPFDEAEFAVQMVSIFLVDIRLPI